MTETESRDKAEELDIVDREIQQLREDNFALQQKIVVLSRYVVHRSGCRTGGMAWRNNESGPCNCGLEEARK